MIDASFPPLVSGLLKPDAYPHRVRAVQLRQTHISWILLTGDFAYKIKKPVDLGFVDFTTLERRHYFCTEEVRLNRRFAPDLYLDVVAIARQDGMMRICGEGKPVEFAVRMRQFDETRLASQLLSDEQLTATHIDELAVVMTSLHDSAARDDAREWGSPAQVREPIVENFAALRPLIGDPARQRQLDQLQEWSLSTCEALPAILERRQEEGFVRECHGDLHLGNIVQWQGAMTPFDCIEFQPALRWIDVMSEIAFLVMDLDVHGRPDLAWRFLNDYLEMTGDYAGLPVLPLYLVYRAIVRAKVDALRLHQTGICDGDQRLLTADQFRHLDLATGYTQPRTASLTITHGVSGSGKTTGTQSLVQHEQAIRVRSDVERKRLFGLDPAQSAADDVAAGIYSPEATEQTYDRLAHLAQNIIGAGFPVIVDATFLRGAQRRRFRELAGKRHVPFAIIPFALDDQTLRERISRRSTIDNDASDATLHVLQHQLHTCEPLTPDELPFVLSPGTWAGMATSEPVRPKGPGT